jgi:hypothetical protein
MRKKPKPHKERKSEDYIEAADNALELAKVLAGARRDQRPGVTGSILFSVRKWKNELTLRIRLLLACRKKGRFVLFPS